MKVYLIEFNNGEAYEDFYSWIDDVVYLNKEDCINSLRDKGYVEDTIKIFGETITYWYRSDEEHDWFVRRINAEISELEVIE